jgi:hypothetical protein
VIELDGGVEWRGVGCVLGVWKDGGCKVVFFWFGLVWVDGFTYMHACIGHAIEGDSRLLKGQGRQASRHARGGGCVRIANRFVFVFHGKATRAFFRTKEKKKERKPQEKGQNGSIILF